VYSDYRMLRVYRFFLELDSLSNLKKKRNYHTKSVHNYKNSEGTIKAFLREVVYGIVN
jgi:hypothetical protein